MNPFDTFSPTIPLAISVGRWGCLMIGCDCGKLSHVPWAICYPRESLAFSYHAQPGWIGYFNSYSLPVRPNQGYLSVNGLILVLLLSWTWKRYKIVSGALLNACFGCYMVLQRFIIECFIEPVDLFFLFDLNMPQGICLICVCASSVIFLQRFRTVFGVNHPIKYRRRSHENF